MPRSTFPVLLIASLWISGQLHGQEKSPFDKAAEARDEARKRAEMRREQGAGSTRMAPALPGAPAKDDAFDKANNVRESARQRAFDRGQKTALPAQEERESIGRMPDVARNAVRADDGSVVTQGPPAAAVYNRVMETQRFFAHYQDPYLRNANDSFTDKPEDRKIYETEAQRLYPELLLPKSTFAMRQSAIDRWVDSHQPPLVRDARRKLLVAHMVSLELTGKVRADRFGLGQVPQLHMMGQRPPAFIKRNNFDIEVRENEVKLPDGLRGKVTRGKDKLPDIIEWLDAEGSHRIAVPQEPSGKLRLFKNYDCDYRRYELQDGNYRVIFTKPH